MTIAELKEIINVEELDDNCQTRLGDKPQYDNEYGIYKEGDKWIVFLTGERGGFEIKKTHDRESEACEHLLALLRVAKWQDELIEEDEGD